MPEPSSGRAALWIVQGPDVVSGKLRQSLAADDVRQLDQVSADIVVLSMTPERAERLKAQFPDLIVEPDSTLEPSVTGRPVDGRPADIVPRGRKAGGDDHGSR